MNDNNPSIESERRLVTVMFADIAGFTAMSEKMDPEVITDLMNTCFRMMEKIIEEHGGTIDKFIGDCVMALFGAPKALENAPHRAIDTALAMKDRIQRFNMEKDLPVPLGFHIGINTGEVIAGMVGGEKRQDFTVMGDTVNLASRLAGAAEKGSILVAEGTYRLTEGYFDFTPVGEVSVKGKAQPVRAYQMLGTRRTLTRVHAAKGLSPFTGRAEELVLLKDRFEQAAAGQGQVVGIVGEPGVGKSRLIRHFRESLAPDTYTGIEGGCVHFGDAIPYLPILDLLKDCFAIKEQDDEVSSKANIQQVIARLDGNLDGITPPLHELLSLKVEDEAYARLDAKQRRDRTFWAIRDLFLAESQVRPLVVIIEDLHWIDKTSEEFLRTFIPQLANARILLVLLFRPEYTPAGLEHASYTQIRLEQLPQEMSAELVQGILGGGTVEQDLCDFITLRAEGSPLFIEELTWNLLENGSIIKAHDRYRLALKPADIQVPATVQGIIAARLDRLEDNLKKLLQTASVIGREFAFRILQVTAALREDLRSSLLSLQDMEYIYAKAILPELEYIFKHALTQEVAYNSLLIKKRKETHARVGQAIEQLYSDRLEEFYEMLAYHYGMSEDMPKAYEYLKRAGDKARKNYSNREALRFYQEAIRVLDAMPATRKLKQAKMEIYIDLFAIEHLLFYPEGSRELFLAAENLAQELEDHRSLSAVYSRMGIFYTIKIGDIGLSLAYSERSFDAALKAEDIELIAPSAPDLCVGHFMGTHYGKVVEIVHKTLPLLEKHHREKDFFGRWVSVYSTLCAYGGCSLGYLGKFRQGKKMLNQGFENSSAIDDKFGMAWACNLFSFVSFFEGDGIASVEHAHTAIKYYQATVAENHIPNAWFGLGCGKYLLGEYTEARDHIEMSIRRQMEGGMRIALVSYYWLLSFIHMAMGDLHRARESAQETLQLSQEFNMRGQEGVALTSLGSILGQEDPRQFEQATEYIRQGIAIQEELGIKSWYAQGYMLLGELFAHAGRKDKARVNLQQAESLYLEMQVTPQSSWLARIRDDLARL